MLTERDSLHIPTMKQAEDARRLDRYDEAIALLRMSEHARPGSVFFRAYEIKRDEFLAAEPKVGEGGR